MLNLIRSKLINSLALFAMLVALCCFFSATTATTTNPTATDSVVQPWAFEQAVFGRARYQSIFYGIFNNLPHNVDGSGFRFLLNLHPQGLICRTDVAHSLLVLTKYGEEIVEVKLDADCGMDGVLIELDPRLKYGEFAIIEFILETVETAPIVVFDDLSLTSLANNVVYFQNAGRLEFPYDKPFAKQVSMNYEQKFPWQSPTEGFIEVPTFSISINNTLVTLNDEMTFSSSVTSFSNTVPAFYLVGKDNACYVPEFNYARIEVTPVEDAATLNFDFREIPQLAETGISFTIFCPNWAVLPQSKSQTSVSLMLNGIDWKDPKNPINVSTSWKMPAWKPFNCLWSP